MEKNKTILTNKISQNDSHEINIDDLLTRRYTKELENNHTKTVYDLFKWKTIDIELKDYKTGKNKFELHNAEFPIDYSQTACDIIAEKYFRRTNVPNDRNCEYSMKQITHRMINQLVESAIDEGLINQEQGQIVYDELVFMMLSQMFAFNSPQWFNTGLKYYNKDVTEDGSYYYDTKSKKVVQATDNHERTQASACFIIGIEDKLLGKKSISDQYATETKLFKGGSGTGTNYSTIRAKGEKLSGGGTSSGIMSFLKGFDVNAGTIKSGGTLRRSAKMNQLDVDHPEILEYMTWKSKEEQKVRDLGKMGYDTSFEGEAYETVSGQNANNTVRFSDEFMFKVEKYLKDGIDEEFELKGRIDKSINRKEKVSTIWNTFIKSAWECADPAPQFDDTVNSWHTCPCGEDGIYNAKHNRINSTNPLA